MKSVRIKLVRLKRCKLYIMLLNSSLMADKYVTRLLNHLVKILHHHWARNMIGFCDELTSVNLTAEKLDITVLH